MNTEHPKTHTLWEAFAIRAELDGISLDHPDDWEMSWNLFLAGAQASREYQEWSAKEIKKYLSGE